MSEWDKFLDKLQVFERLYHAMRVVDPVSKQVMELAKGEFREGENECHDFWLRNMICENCISMRALNGDDTVFKIENKDQKIYLVTAVPAVVMGKRVVVELLKETTNSLVLGDGKHGEDVGIYSMIESMNRAVVKDALTEAYNRRFIDERLPVELLQASIQNEPLSVIFADIDFFKNVNDTYGHAAGDMVLKEFVKELEVYIRKNRDWVARYGGEEFIICLPGADRQTAGAIAEKIRTGVENKEYRLDDSSFHITCSLGVYTVSDDSRDRTVGDILDAVDKKLYQAKSEGRNRIV